MNRQENTVLLTGATGLIGRHSLRALLRAGATVHAISRNPPSEAGVVWHRGDLLDQRFRADIFREVRPGKLLHFAWDVRPPAYLESDANFAWLAASLEMLRSFHEQGGERAVMAGTCFEYGRGDGVLRETSPVRPASTYGKCKDHLNCLAGLFCANNGLSYGWGRIFPVYGAGEHAGRLLPALLAAAASGEALTIRNGGAIRDYLHAGDVGRAMAAFLLSGVEGVVNVCSGVGIGVADFCRLVAASIGREDFFHFGDESGEEAVDLIGDAGRLCREVGFVPEFDLARGIAEVVGEMRMGR